MAYELVDAVQLNNDLLDIADAIRAKSGAQEELLFPSEFISEIGSIPTGASITGATDVTCKALANISENGTCLIAKKKFTYYFDTTSDYVACTSCCWSPDSSRFVEGFGSASPRMRIFDTATQPFSKITNPSTLPASTVYGCQYSPDGSRLAMAHNTSPFITIYDTSTSPYTKITNPSTLPTGNGRNCAWNPNGSRLAVGHVNSPYITIYDTTTTPYTKISDPATLPGAQVNGLDWSPDGKYLIATFSASPYIIIYDTTTTPYTKISDPTILPASSGKAKYSPDGTMLAIAQTSSPYMILYDTTSIPYTKLSNPASASLPQSNVTGVSWSPDGSVLAMCYPKAPGFVAYDTSTIPFTKIDGPDIHPIYTNANPAVNCCDWSPDGRFFAIGSDAQYPIFVYLYVKSTPLMLPINNRNIPGADDFSFGYSKSSIASGYTGTAAALFEP